MAERDTTTTTTVTSDDTTSTTTTTQAENGSPRTDEPKDQVGAGAKAPSTPSNKDLLDSAASASPHATRDSDTKVLGHEGKTPAESQEDAKREAMVNAQGEQDLH